jgi:hypothetical protein
MNLSYDSDLIEGVVFLESRRMPALLAQRFQRARAKLYELPADDRDAAFFRFHLEWFRGCGLEDRLLGALKQFPLIRQHAATFLVRKALSKNDEGAELFVRPDAKNVAIALRSERFFEPGLELWLAHELCHISDMLDPTFAYEPDIRMPDAPPAELDLLRERYRVLWDVTIDGRLNQNKPARLAEFQKALPTLSEKIFNELWSARPSHPELVALAKSVLVRAERTPGAPCPLCKFPTFVWANAPLVDAIRRDFPRWLPEHGCCARCAELYSMHPQEQPATLFV